MNFIKANAIYDGALNEYLNLHQGRLSNKMFDVEKELAWVDVEQSYGGPNPNMAGTILSRYVSALYEIKRLQQELRDGPEYKGRHSDDN